MNLSDIEGLRSKNPIVVNYSNFVTPFLVANGLNAIGASPIMSNEGDEATELATIASAVVVNLGTARKEDEEFINQLCQTANQRKIPLVLDPVAIGATKYRKKLGLELLKKYHFDIIRGNIGEIAVLAGIDWQTHGIDAGDSTDKAKEVVQKCAQRYETTVIASGKVDYISDGNRVVKILNNTDLLPLIVGSGDLLSSVAGAFCAVVKTPLEAAQIASLVVSCSGEAAAQVLEKQTLPGKFMSELLDQMANITSKQVTETAKVEEA
ncbi:hydroxyethylthiazole kinase [Pediococcus claussenii]|uniref:Hydroxyethylthiazole kinase n=1 Tax=Pediococcus claussenii (strain ATCC BAA-344 / DSM 14800 / JCM 18046 / KCTC 3811 / LMG 21948 / P06) TaxID=701521 RepID=G8PAJ0_PEDCP|nr:hydroxyethylthiazole kinase [Pediococcus claussenii]AEV95779.1 hydroxyethylthiazole kinase family protein [Pediococcus claussenii ATCC BAA-344]ANZ69283.1 hydroxyethylthiazole kinase [Pediococcus claussenii]ANZ71103.1 hydroxyethylthiazole kinase [Pediococcus claussenii]KRN20389.1 hypothetical protein IV79_GL000442 [Pediococcus claussenii]